jgi:tRNA(Ile)-lysidine synthase TilS/MesJ
VKAVDHFCGMDRLDIANRFIDLCHPEFRFPESTDVEWLELAGRIWQEKDWNNIAGKPF